MELVGKRVLFRKQNGHLDGCYVIIFFLNVAASVYHTVENKAFSCDWSPLIGEVFFPFWRKKPVKFWGRQQKAPFLSDCLFFVENVPDEVAPVIREMNRYRPQSREGVKGRLFFSYFLKANIEWAYREEKKRPPLSEATKKLEFDRRLEEEEEVGGRQSISGNMLHTSLVVLKRDIFRRKTIGFVNIPSNNKMSRLTKCSCWAVLARGWARSRIGIARPACKVCPKRRTSRPSVRGLDRRARSGQPGSPRRPGRLSSGSPGAPQGRRRPSCRWPWGWGCCRCGWRRRRPGRRTRWRRRCTPEGAQRRRGGRRGQRSLRGEGKMHWTIYCKSYFLGKWY